MKKKIFIILILTITFVFSAFYISKLSKVNQCENFCDQEYKCSTEVIGCQLYVCKDSCNSIELSIPNNKDKFSIAIKPLNKFLSSLTGYIFSILRN